MAAPKGSTAGIAGVAVTMWASFFAELFVCKLLHFSHDALTRSILLPTVAVCCLPLCIQQVDSHCWSIACTDGEDQDGTHRLVERACGSQRDQNYEILVETGYTQCNPISSSLS